MASIRLSCAFSAGTGIIFSIAAGFAGIDDIGTAAGARFADCS